MIENYLIIEPDSKSKENRCRERNEIWIYNPTIFDLCRKFSWL